MFYQWLVAAFALALCACASTPKRDAAIGTTPDTATDRASTTRAPAPVTVDTGDYQRISLSGFSDSTGHFQNEKDDKKYAQYRPEQVVAIANNILLYQRDIGGWASNWDPTRILSSNEAARVWNDRNKLDTSFDNRSTYTQVEYLAHAFNQTGKVEFRDAAVRGLNFMLRAQDPSGGWPHSYPRTNGYFAHITLLDDVMIGVLTTLRKAAYGEAPFEFLTPEVKGRCLNALTFGDAALLRLQVEVKGELTVWAGQYDRRTLKPTKARSFELPSLVAAESVRVVRYLMSIEPPTPEISRAIEAAVRWFERSKIEGLRIERVSAKEVRYEHHTSRGDKREVKDPKAPPIWARFYTLKTNRPFMANRNGKKVYTLSKVERERRTGYTWYGYWPKTLLKKHYPRWRKRWAQLKTGPGT